MEDFKPVEETPLITSLLGMTQEAFDAYKEKIESSKLPKKEKKKIEIKPPSKHEVLNFVHNNFSQELGMAIKMDVVE